MKGKRYLLIVSIAVLFPLQVHGQLQVVDGVVTAVLEKSHLDQVIYYGQSIMQMIANVENTYYQVQMMIEAEKRALQNLKGIADVKSWDEFMKWQNRQLYLERQVEDRFNNMGVKIGKETYRIEDIEQIPGAMRKNFGDEYWDDFTEEQRAEMYYTLGLSPSNYAYIQTWQEREARLARKFLTQPEIIADENDEAAERNRALVEKYTREDGTLDINQILKETGITMANLEMVLRDQSHLMAQFYEYQAAKDKEEHAPSTPPRLTDHYWDNYWRPITKGVGENHFEE